MNNNHRQSHKRSTIRLQGYDYRLPGAYFITISTWQRECFFGEVVKGEMRLSRVGHIVHSEWRRLEDLFPHVRAEEFVVMPNHIHGIIIIESVSVTGATCVIPIGMINSNTAWENQIGESHDGVEENVGATRSIITRCIDTKAPMLKKAKVSHDGSPLRKNACPNGPLPGSLGAIIGQFKSRVTKRIWTLPGLERRPIWQRNYYERIIRDEEEFKRIVQYIDCNVMKWEEDRYFSSM
jgi:putative transposase